MSVNIICEQLLIWWPCGGIGELYKHVQIVKLDRREKEVSKGFVKLKAERCLKCLKMVSFNEIRVLQVQRKNYYDHLRLFCAIYMYL